MDWMLYFKVLVQIVIGLVVCPSAAIFSIICFLALLNKLSDLCDRIEKDL